MQANGDSGCIAPFILNLGTRWRSVGSFTLATLPRGKDPQYSLNGRVDGPQRWSGWFGEEINLLPLPELEPQIM